MHYKLLYTYLFYYFVIFSFVRCIAVLLSSKLRPKERGEKRVRYIANYSAILDIFHFLLALLFLQQNMQLTVPNFILPGANFNINWNGLSLAFLGFAIITISLINRFSIFYLHRDPYYYKFFGIVYILQMSLSLLILTTNRSSIFMGWELLGLASVLLIAFHEYRSSVLRNSLIILVLYKISDTLLYSILIYSAVGGIEDYNIITNPILVLGVLVVCMIKSSVFPWFWLPRAMEGPTQSSAVFYGGLATHVPVFIFINVWQNQPVHEVNVTIIVLSAIIGSSIICSSLLSRSVNDAKNAIAYSTITQLGIIYLEVIWGFFGIAIIHCIVHGIYRTIEFLKAPSLLYSRYVIEQNRKSISSPGTLYKQIVPKVLRCWLYRLCYREFIMPKVLINMIESFISLSSSRVNKASLLFYVLYSLPTLIIVEGVTVYFFHRKITMQDESLLVICYILNLLALSSKYSTKLFFLAFMSSVCAAITILAAQIFPILYHSFWFYMLLTIYIIHKTYATKSLYKDTINFTGRTTVSSTFSVFLLILGLLILAMPGPGFFLIWEMLEHTLLSSHSGLIINAYILLSFNTIVFFRFYYANYFGKYDPLKHFYSAYRY